MTTVTLRNGKSTFYDHGTVWIGTKGLSINACALLRSGRTGCRRHKKLARRMGYATALGPIAFKPFQRKAEQVFPSLEILGRPIQCRDNHF